MKIKHFILIFILSLAVVGGFFYKTLFFKYVPFPGDLLVSEYSPWKYSSFLGYNPGSYPNKAQYIDTIKQTYPWKTFVIDSFKKGAIPLWNPYNFSGAPLLANFQSGVFYPLNLLYFLLPQIWAWSGLIILQPFLALIFTYLYARKIGISKIGSLFASLSFAFSSFMSVWLEYNTIGHVILWLPLILLSLEELSNKKSAIWALILVFTLSSSLFAGHIQIFAYLFLFTLLYVFVKLRRISLFILSLFILSIGVGAIQLFPGMELITQAARSAHTYDFIINKALLQWWQLVMLLVPDFFGNPATRNYWIQDTYIGDVIYLGLVPLFFVFLTFFGKKNYYVKFYVAALIIIFVLITRNPLTELFYKINIPLISSSASNLLVFLVCFSLSILCGFGVDIFIKNKYSFKEYAKIWGFLALIFLLLWIVVLVLPKFNWFSWGVNLPVSFHNLIYSTTIFIIALSLFLSVIINHKLKTAVVVCLLIFSIFDLWRFFQKFNPFSPIVSVYPQNLVLDFIKKNSGINRFWGYRSAAIPGNIATTLTLFSPEGYDPLYSKRYGELIQASNDGKIHTEFTDQTRSDAVIAQNLGELRILNLLGVKYILDRNENGSTQKTFPTDMFSLIYQQNGWKIFENKKALPRIFLATDYAIYKSKEEFEKLFFSGDFDLSKTILLEEKPDGFKIGASKLGVVKLISYDSNEINIEVNTDINKLLFLSDTYYPGWKAYVDGNETKIYRADYAFRSIVVPQGNYRIKFSYEPLSFRIGYITSLISLGLFAVLLLAVKKKLSNI